MNFCPPCSTVYCEQCAENAASSRCPQCKRAMKEVLVKPQDALDIDLDWFEIDGRRSPLIGVAELEHFPSSIPLMKLLKAKDPLSQFIVCPDEGSVESVSISYAQHLDLPLPEYASSQRGRIVPGSRYRTLPLSTDKPDTAVFLNSSALDTTDVEFIIEYLQSLQPEIWKAKSMRTFDLMWAIADGIISEQRRYGFPFARLDEHRIEWISRVAQVMIASWAQYEAVRNVRKTSDPSALARFVSHRLDLFEKCVLGEAGEAVLIGSLLDMFMQYLLGFSLCMALKKGTGMRTGAMRRLMQTHRKVVDKVSSVPSLGEALETVTVELAKTETFDRMEDFEKAIPSIIESAYGQLKPEFFDLSGSLALMEFARDISERLSMAPWSIPEPVINDFLETCERISKKSDIHQLPALVASLMKFQVLLSFAFFIHHPVILPRVERTARENLLRFEGRIESMEIPLEEVGISDADLLLDVWYACCFCIMLGDFERAKRLKGLLEDRKHVPEARTALAQLLWAEFIAYEDYDSLARLRGILPEVRSEHVPMNELLEPMFDLYETLADAILQEDDRFERLARAQLKAADSDISPTMPVKDAMQYVALNVFLATLPCLYRASMSESKVLLASNLHHAVEACRYFSKAEKPQSPNHLIFLKTVLLEKMALGEPEEVSDLVDTILNHPFSSANTSVLCEIASKWVDSTKGDEDIVLSALDTQSPPHSPWIRTARRLLATDARKSYMKTIRASPAGAKVDSLQGLAGFLKGTVLELALQVCFLMDDYDVERRVLYEGLEVVDLLCHKGQEQSVEVILVDVKSARKTYGPKEARDFAMRVRKTLKGLDVLIPLEGGKNHEVRAIVANLSRISQNAHDELNALLQDVPCDFLTGEDLVEFLDRHGTMVPSVVDGPA